jgi:predicted short-subunit dehydrogenase-like oxidoreductase (DUF2520 family)
MLLLESTISNLSHLSPERAVTGPFSRGDLETIKLHMNALSKTESDALKVYRLLGQHALILAGRKIDPAVAEGIRRRLRQK